MRLSLFLSNRFLGRGYKTSTVSKSIITLSRIILAASYVIILVTISTGFGLNRAVSTKISALNGHIVITNLLNEGEEETRVPIDQIEKSILSPLEGIEGIKDYRFFTTKSAIIQANNNSEVTLIKGVSKNYDLTYFNDFLIEGSIPVYNDTALSRKVLISEKMARQLSLSVDDRFKSHFFDDLSQENPIRTRTLEVGGIFSTSFKEYDEAIMIADLLLIQKVNRWNKNQIGGVEVILKDPSVLAQKEEEIYNAISTDLDSTSIKDKYPTIFEWIEIFYFNIIIIFAVVFMVTAVSISITLLVLIIEKITLVGLFKAIGMGGKIIQKFFIYTCMHIIGKGLIWGNILGVPLLLIQKYTYFIKLDPENYYVSSIPVYLNLELILSLNILLVMLCVVILVLPSYFITKIKPARAIAYNN